MLLKSLLVAGAIAVSAAGFATPAIADSDNSESVQVWHRAGSWQEEKAWEKCEVERDKYLSYGVLAKCEYEAPKVHLYIWF